MRKVHCGQFAGPLKLFSLPFIARDFALSFAELPMKYPTNLVFCAQLNISIAFVKVQLIHVTQTFIVTLSLYFIYLIVCLNSVQMSAQFYICLTIINL